MITQNCKNCNQPYQADQRYLNRNQGLFCNRSCAAVYANLNRTKVKLICKYCNTDFLSKNARALFCNNKCRRKERENRLGKPSIDTRSTLSNKINKSLPNGTKQCFECSWNDTVCDIHHIIPQSKGGSDKFDNLTVLCPNCHRKADRGLLTNFTTVSDRIGLYHQLQNKELLDA